MDIQSLVRDADAVRAQLSMVGDRVVAKQLTYVYIPVSFEERKLAEIAAIVKTIGFYAMVVDGKYCVSKVCADVHFRPSSINRIVIDEDDYYELQFDPGAVIIENINVLQVKSILYYIFDHIVAKGKIPWYFNYDDMGKLFLTAQKHAGVSLGVQNTIHEMIAASISRQSQDRTKYFRHSITTPKDIADNKPAFIPFRSVVYGATNTTSRLLGSYFDDNMLSATVNPSESVEGVEALLRA